MTTISQDVGVGRHDIRPDTLKVTTFGIGGMHCAACASRNERALKKLSGVREAAVNFGMRNARVVFDEGGRVAADDPRRGHRRRLSGPHWCL